MIHADLFPAFLLAEYAHRVLPKHPENAWRKWTVEEPVPYIVHPVSVMFRVMELKDYDYTMGRIALLHDVVEDTNLEENRIRELGEGVYDGVIWLTSHSKITGSTAKRADRKLADRDHLAKAPPQIRSIKICDRLDNFFDLGNAEPGFVRLYANETIALLDAIEKGCSAQEQAAQLRGLCEKVLEGKM